MDKIMCDAGCGYPAEIHLNDAAYCGDCFGVMASEHLQELTGWKPCGHPIWPKGGRAPALCMERHGTEHSHADFFCDGQTMRDG